ncbi:MAG: hypothetical protein IKO68_03060 [Oscillospiraceae bacterium]|nr:hypothetical protein [Oscillospiraceae bacterium]
MQQRKTSIFRNQAVEKISSPDLLSDYLRVTNPGVWVVLAVVILLLAGLLVWACVGTLETTAAAKVIVEDHKAEVFLPDGSSVEAGMPLRVAGQEVKIASVETDKYGRTLCYAELFVPDGTYDGVVVVQQIRPISFLFKSN